MRARSLHVLGFVFVAGSVLLAVAAEQRRGGDDIDGGNQPPTCKAARIRTATAS